MPLQISDAYSSRITKPAQRRKTPLFRRTISSPQKSATGSLNPRKGLKRSATEFSPEDDEAHPHTSVGDRATVLKVLVPSGQPPQHVPDIITYIREHMFDPIPEAGGFNSVRIAEILNFRRHLPPIVTVAHVHALTTSSTKIEREIAELAARGTLRRLHTPGRGVGGSSISEGLCLMEDVRRIAHQSLDTALAGKRP